MLKNWLIFILNNSGLISQVVTVDQIYNEFSGGIPDIAGNQKFFQDEVSEAGRHRSSS